MKSKTPLIESFFHYIAEFLYFQLVAHEIGHVLGLHHPMVDGLAKGTDCPPDGLMGKWWAATKWGSCANQDLKSMYKHFVIDRGYNWCLDTNANGNKFQTTQQKDRGNSC